MKKEQIKEMEADRPSSNSLPPPPPEYSDPPPPMSRPPPPPPPPPLPLQLGYKSSPLIPRPSPRSRLDIELRSLHQQLAETTFQDQTVRKEIVGGEPVKPSTSGSISDPEEILDGDLSEDRSDWQHRLRSFYLHHNLDLDFDLVDDDDALDGIVGGHDDDVLLNILLGGENKPTYPCGEEIVTECLICFETVTLYRRLCCFFPACDNCMKMYLVSEVNNANVEIKCISGVCDSYVHRDEILGRLPADMKEKYYRFLVNANKDPDVKTCPRCSHIYQLAESQAENDHGKYGRLVHCPTCQLHWCFSCHAPWHAGVKCRDFQKGDQLLRTWAKEHHYGHPNAQKCPRCKIFIERKGGCDHMVCSKCNSSFCYRCGERYWKIKFFGDHSSRFSPFGCKYNYKPQHNVLRKAVRGSVFGAKLVGGAIVLGLGLAAVAVLIGASVVILPAYGGCKFYKMRAMKKRHKRRQQLFKLRTKNAMLESLRERAVLERLAEKQPQPRDTVHIGIQTSQSQQVDVTVHNPYQESVASSEQTEIRMNIKDENGQVTLTTAEITPGDNPDEAEIVLHVRTSYSRSTSYNAATVNNPSYSRSTSYNAATGNNPCDIVADSGNVGYENLSSSESKSSEYESGSQRGSVSWKNKKKILRSRSVDNASLNKKVSKKVESGSLSKSNRKCLVIKNDETGSSALPDLGVSGSFASSPAVEEGGDTDGSHQTALLSQSGCFLKLFSKKLNTLQGQIELDNKSHDKSHDKSHGPKINVIDTEMPEQPDIVHCTLGAELKRQNRERVEDSNDIPDLELHRGIVTNRKAGVLPGMVAPESCQTYL